MRNIVLGILFFVMNLGVGAAQEIKLKSFKILEGDTSAIEHPRLDLNDYPCSILKVKSKEKDLIFEGNVIGKPEYHNDEIWVYVPQRSTKILIRHEKYGVLRYNYPKDIKRNTSYYVKLKFVKSKLDDKIRTLAMPILGFCGGTPSYGVMVGLVKKTGFYIKYLDLFVGQHDWVGHANKSNDLFTGKTTQEGLSATGGLLQRIGRSPLYAYIGAGFVRRKLYWEAYNEDWLSSLTGSQKVWKEVSDKYVEGLNFEIGGIYRYRNLAVSAALQTGQFNLYQMNFGIGIMY